MAQHAHLAPLFAEGVYFAHPGSPWMRPTNENTNGLLRQYQHPRHPHSPPPHPRKERPPQNS
jgi:IS30 family transposase